MTGAQLLTYVKRRLAENGLTLEADRADELYDYITDGRDDVLEELTLDAPDAVKETITLQVVTTDPPVWKIPDATKDLMGILELRDAGTGFPLTPSSSLNNDGGHYRLNSPRRVQLADDAILTGSLEADVVTSKAAIAAGTAEADIGLPVPCHRAIGLCAAVLALTADEESDARTAIALYSRRLDRLKKLYGNFDRNSGLALREAFMASEGDLHGDMLN
jgi:hypothetical protein